MLQRMCSCGLDLYGRITQPAEIASHIHVLQPQPQDSQADRHHQYGEPNGHDDPCQAMGIFLSWHYEAALPGGRPGRQRQKRSKPIRALL